MTALFLLNSAVHAGHSAAGTLFFYVYSILSLTFYNMS